MFESSGPAVPGSLVMAGRKADFLPYLSWEVWRSSIGFPEGHPRPRDVLGCGSCGAGSRGPAPAIWATVRLAGGKRGRAKFHVQRRVAKSRCNEEPGE